MIGKIAEEYFFLGLGGRIGDRWEGYLPGQRLTVMKEKLQRNIDMYVVGPCNARTYFDTITAHELLRLEARGYYYNCHFVSQQENGVLEILMCRVDGMFRPEDLLM